MTHLFTLILLLFACQIMRYAGMKRFAYFVIGISFIPFIVNIPAPYLPSYRLFCLTVVVSSLLRYKSFVGQLQRFPCKWFLLLVLASHFATAFMDNRLSLGNSLWKAVMSFVDTFLMLAVGYFSLYDNRQLKDLNKILIVVSLVICSYGLFTGVLGADRLGQLLGGVYGIESDFSPLRSLNRTRLTSFLFDSHLFGFYCSTLFTTIFFLNRRSLFRSYTVPMTLALLLCCVFFSGSRSSLLGLFAGLTCSVFLSGNPRQIIRYVFCGIFALGIMTTILATREKLSSVSDMFKGDGGKTEGSSLNMRERQLELSLYLHKQSPVWGNGFNYFNEFLKTDEKLIRKQGLMGAESYLFVLLIEAGMVQMCCIGMFFLSLLAYFLSKLRTSPTYALWGITILIQFVLVIFITGAFGRWQYALPFVGLAMRAICNQKELLCYERH